MAANIGALAISRILKNSAMPLMLTLFLLAVSYAAYSMGYGAAALFFFLIAVASGVVLYKKAANEWIREKYTIDHLTREPDHTD